MRKRKHRDDLLADVMRKQRNAPRTRRITVHVTPKVQRIVSVVYVRRTTKPQRDRSFAGMIARTKD
jgi:hypothetical protein